MILTNPPFGGEEEKAIQGNFPEDKRTAETALLFLQLIMRKLRRHAKSGSPPARAAVIVPNGTLFGDGVCARIKEELLKDFNLHTIVRLPNGVFAPYTGFPPTSCFHRSGSPARLVLRTALPEPQEHTKTAPISTKNSHRLWPGGPNAKTTGVESTRGGVSNNVTWFKIPRRHGPLPPDNWRQHRERRRIAEIVGNIQDLGRPLTSRSWPTVLLREI